jgi:hypothetical protein
MPDSNEPFRLILGLEKTLSLCLEANLQITSRHIPTGVSTPKRA